MAETITLDRELQQRGAAPGRARPQNLRSVRWLLIGITALFLGYFCFMPLAVVFATALQKGFRNILCQLQGSGCAGSHPA